MLAHRDLLSPICIFNGFVHISTIRHHGG